MIKPFEETKNTSANCWRSKQMCSYTRYANHIHLNTSIFSIFKSFYQSLNLLRLLSHDGKEGNMLKTNVRKIDVFKLHLWHGATLVGKYKFPQLAPTQGIPTKVISFNERSGIRKPEECWIDFFIDDVQFESFWNQPERSLDKLRNFAGVITPDFSMLPEMLPSQRIWNCTRNRVMAYYLQHQGLNIIPVASWCMEEDFDWCFDGLHNNSSIAITTNGCMSSPYGKHMLLRGVEELQKQKSPSNLIICGRHVKELDIYSNVHYYPSFSQRWKNRGA